MYQCHRSRWHQISTRMLTHPRSTSLRSPIRWSSSPPGGGWRARRWSRRSPAPDWYRWTRSCSAGSPAAGGTLQHAQRSSRKTRSNMGSVMLLIASYLCQEKRRQNEIILSMPTQSRYTSLWHDHDNLDNNIPLIGLHNKNVWGKKWKMNNIWRHVYVCNG